MGRRTHTRALSIWTNGQRVGTWRIPARGDMELLYDADWKQSAVGRPLSLSLPFGVGEAPLRGERVNHFFDNLLPDSDAIRRRLAARFGTATTEPFDLLAALGRDCIGAVQLLGEDDAPTGLNRIDGTPLSDDDVARVLDQASGVATAGGDDDDFRLSLAGAQEKTALLFHDGRWMRPHGATPTTHILKLPLGLVGNKRADLTASVENEWLCLAILRAYGLSVAQAEIVRFGAHKVLSVARFDRALHRDGGWLLRLPQEDFCQALGVPPHLKYESHGGPGVPDLAGLLRHSETSREDLDTLFAALIVFWMLAAPDGHAKNFSLRLLAGGRFRLTPLYDVMSIWPVEGDGANQWSWHKAKLAMAVHGKRKHYAMRDITRRHFSAMAEHCLLGDIATPIVERLVAMTPHVIESVAAALPPGFPARVAERILGGLRFAAQRLDAMPRE
ncbi:type II toxin-antitoxin system HipA family toxin [Burkholderia cepacia]|uniref:type II toxin-antitoxin system HipA family toxin n=1 Tax=Burkholderia cepacia TaxID=292 RepID=UPI000756A6C3|nr:type II toxin-antitoxin system HipA family toxin [Burkholderia cepacia]KVH59674.1 toxin HipA [Burkholderia cepacia]KWF90252.1 toxin HipA [Burkholderia cepacia]RQT72057.1 type II toxin-antitoxin system HipA family toxin [Burkholderia cepacia]UQO38573.1 type II toxin-antitoxin system HipA family toxin [Burkholderia cepacia]UQO52910.1 type II toxin-antitoxin system HipA family toxin [Burkholderia cepacia]